MFRRPRSVSGFTLIELLVVIAIIAILAAILFPVFTQAQQSSLRSSCQNNLKQFGVAFTTYLDDNGGVYMSGTVPFTYAVQKYMKSTSICQCKADTRRVLPTGFTGRDADRVSYMCNAWLWTDCGTSTARPLTLAQITSPSKLILLTDDSQGDGSTKACFGDPNVGSSYSYASNKGRHLGIDNYLLADTHVKAVKVGSTQTIADGSVSYQSVGWNPAKLP